MAVSPPNPTRRCQRAQVTEEAMSRPRSRQRAHTLAGRAKKRAATKSGCPRGIGGPQSVSSVARVLSTVVAQTSGRGIKDIVLQIGQQQSSYPEFPLLPLLSHSLPLISTICERLSKSARGVSGNFQTVALSVGRLSQAETLSDSEHVHSGIGGPVEISPRRPLGSDHVAFHVYSSGSAYQRTAASADQLRYRLADPYVLIMSLSTHIAAGQCINTLFRGQSQSKPSLTDSHWIERSLTPVNSQIFKSQRPWRDMESTISLTSSDMWRQTMEGWPDPVSRSQVGGQET